MAGRLPAEQCITPAGKFEQRPALPDGDFPAGRDIFPFAVEFRRRIDFPAAGKRAGVGEQQYGFRSLPVHGGEEFDGFVGASRAGDPQLRLIPSPVSRIPPSRRLSSVLYSESKAQ